MIKVFVEGMERENEGRGITAPQLFPSLVILFYLSYNLVAYYLPITEKFRGRARRGPASLL